MAGLYMASRHLLTHIPSLRVEGSSILQRAHTRHYASARPKRAPVPIKRRENINAIGQADELSRKAALTPVEQLDQLMRAQRSLPHVDMFGQGLELFDLEIPYSTHLKYHRRYPSYRAMVDQWVQNQRNKLKNTWSVFLLLANNAVPGFDSSFPTWTQKYLKWPFYSLQTHSVNPKACLAPFRAHVLGRYKDLNNAACTRDIRALRDVTTGKFYDTRVKLLRSHPGLTKIWRFHSEVTPVRIMSIRAGELYHNPTPPKIGNRMYAQVLVRFDTMQSLELYDENGNAVHPIPPGATKKADGTISAEPMRVTEFIEIEKRMWYDEPWKFRAQFYEMPGKAPTIAL